MPDKVLPTITASDRLYKLMKDLNGRLIDAGGKRSHPNELMLAGGHHHGFIAAVTAAFANHCPLVLRPQHFWLLLAQAVATRSTRSVTRRIAVIGISMSGGTT